MSLFVLGTASHVGKSTIVAAILRSIVSRGIPGAPFKSQNMSLNSFVTMNGKEIAMAQAVQAAAALLPPHEDMNPVLLKPKGEKISQVILFGEPYKDLNICDYYKETDVLLKKSVEAYYRLKLRYTNIIVEGAGGAAEMNLYKRDIANTLLLNELKIPAILVADIERGGVFAQVYGTLKLLPPSLQGFVKGIIVNKFRGEQDLFKTGISELERISGLPVLGVLPYQTLHIPSEDSLSIYDLKVGCEGGIRIAVINLPHISNFTDFELLLRSAHLEFVKPGMSLDSFDCIIIPGTKNSIVALQTIIDSGTALEIYRARERGIPIIGICGGFQILGEKIIDSGVESKKGNYKGLGLLRVTTHFTGYQKTTVQVKRTAKPVPPWIDRIGDVTGYEIHMGSTDLTGDDEAFFGDGAVSQDGLVMGTYLHGLFQNKCAVQALLSFLHEKTGKEYIPLDSLDNDPYDDLKDLFEKNVNMDFILSFMEDANHKTKL